MKKTLLLFLAIGIAATVFGQAGTQTFDLSAGAMFPFGDLADYDLSDSSSGAAATGYHVQVGYNFQLSDNFGVGIDVEFNNARYSMNKVHKYYDGLLDDARKEITSTEGWTIGGIYLRYYIHFPLGSSTSMDISPLIGGMGTYSPEYTIQRTSILPPGPNPTKTYYRQRSKTFSFAYGVNTKLNFKIKNHGLFLEARLIRSQLHFRHVTGTGYDGKTYDKSVKMDVMFLTTSLGYAYYF